MSSVKCKKCGEDSRILLDIDYVPAVTEADIADEREAWVEACQHALDHVGSVSFEPVMATVPDWRAKPKAAYLSVACETCGAVSEQPPVDATGTCITLGTYPSIPKGPWK